MSLCLWQVAWWLRWQNSVLVSSQPREGNGVNRWVGWFKSSWTNSERFHWTSRSYSWWVSCGNFAKCLQIHTLIPLVNIWFSFSKIFRRAWVHEIVRQFCMRVLMEVILWDLLAVLCWTKYIAGFLFWPNAPLQCTNLCWSALSHSHSYYTHTFLDIFLSQATISVKCLRTSRVDLVSPWLST